MFSGIFTLTTVGTILSDDPHFIVSRSKMKYERTAALCAAAMLVHILDRYVIHTILHGNFNALERR